MPPTAARLKPPKKLLTLSKWSNLGENSRALWGECKGSSSKPYLTCIDLLGGPSFRCSCPSRKFPCKHGLALFLLRADQAGAFGNGAPPDWVGEWLEERGKRAETQAKHEEAAKKEADPKVAARVAAKAAPKVAAGRARKREANVRAGVQDLELWLSDLVRQGLATLQTKPYAFWDEMASRMVDAQVPGLAKPLAGSGQLGGAEPQGAAGRGGRATRAARFAASTPRRLQPLRQLNARTASGYQNAARFSAGPDRALAARGRPGPLASLGASDERRSQLDGAAFVVARRKERPHGVRSKFHLRRSSCSASCRTTSPGERRTFEGEVVFFEGNAPQRALVKAQGETEPLTGFSAEAGISGGDGALRAGAGVSALAGALPARPKRRATLPGW